MFLHHTFLFVSIAASMTEIEVTNQQIQTEIVKTVEHVQVGSTTKQQGVYSENKSVCMKKILI